MLAKRLKINRSEKKVMVSMRMPPGLVEQVKKVASKKGVAYQTLIRQWVEERLKSK